MNCKSFTDKINSLRLNGNTLKILGAIFMLIDHVGYILFPKIIILRIIGRMSFPIFAFMIAEGCHYTKNKLNYFLSIFILGVACQLAYYFHNGQLEMSILITFSLSVLTVYSLQLVKETLFNNDSNYLSKFLSVIVFSTVVIGVFFLNKIFKINYGFWGCLAPAFASLVRKPHSSNLKFWNLVDNNAIRLMFFSICLILISIAYGGIQFYSLFSILLLLLYSEKRGEAKLKYFFYIFYPLHLLVLQAISLLLN